MIGILLILAVSAYFMVRTIQSVTDTALKPVKNFGTQAAGLLSPVNEFSTQAAEVLHPTPTIQPDPITIVHEVQSLARLETIQYSVEKVITAEVGQGAFGFLFGDKLLLVAHGTIIAGVDLGKLEAQHLVMEGDTLTVVLPEAEVFVTTLDNDKSYVYDRETGLLTKGNIDLEANARQVAAEEILKAALEDGILEQAQVNAESYLFRLLRNLGFPKVEFLEPIPNNGTE